LKLYLESWRLTLQPWKLSRLLWFILEMQRVKRSTEQLKLDEMWRLTLETGNLLEVHPGTVKASPGPVSHRSSS
jgi:hypothetical protein